MPGSITLPQIVLDLEEEDRQKYEALQPPKSMVVRYGYMKLVGEFPYDGTAKPGCGSKLVLRTNRGLELGEMLTTTCSNGACGKSVSRKEMLAYIENSGGRDYPFSTQGKIVRVATIEDLKEQERLDARKTEMLKFARERAAELKLVMKVVEVEPLLGGDRIIFHYTSENWVDFRELVHVLAQEYQTRIEMHQVNARDEARIVADYEKCGQHCCCKQFLKVLKPVSMRSAKVQKATLDPTKISGRCGRLMCCLRYEDETYDSLKKKLPHKQTRVLTDDGPGTVIDTQILTQLCLIMLDKEPGSPKAYALETIRVMTKEEIALHKATQPQPFRKGQDQPGALGGPGGAGGPRRGRGGSAGPAGDRGPRQGGAPNQAQGGQGLREAPPDEGEMDAAHEDSLEATQELDGESTHHQEQDTAAPLRESSGSSPRSARTPRQPLRPRPGAPIDPETGQRIDVTPPVKPTNQGPNDAEEDDEGDAEDDDATSPSGESSDRGGSGVAPDGNAGGPNAGNLDPNKPRKRRRRRRRRRGGGGGGGQGGPGNAGGAGPSGGGGGAPA